MQLAVFGPNLRDQSKGTFHVHTADCADCRRYRDEERLDMDANTREAVVLEIYPPEDFDYDIATEFGMYASDVWFAPCVPLT
jgi:hypothetical protein